MLDAKLNIKIAEFGLSNLLRAGDFLRTSCGSPNYAAPEVIHAVRANSETVVASDKLDAWSLGVMAVELLSNKAPFNLLEGSAKVCFVKLRKLVVLDDRPGITLH